MKAYKFRGLEQISFAIDMITESRLFCAEWTKLNDPMEGVFDSIYCDEDLEAMPQCHMNLARELSKTRICSLSQSIDSHLLWAHYASGFRGLAIEVELPNKRNLVKKVKYSKSIPYLAIDKQTPPSKYVQQILSSKLKDWVYEKEIRVLTQYEYQKVDIKSVIIGHRSPEWIDATLRAVCHTHRINLSRTKLKNGHIELDVIIEMVNPSHRHVGEILKETG